METDITTEVNEIEASSCFYRLTPEGTNSNSFDALSNTFQTF